MYEAYYGLSKKPFSILPDPQFLYFSASHEMAFTMLEYGLLNQAGFTVITGEIGSGKTTLVRHLLTGLRDELRVGLVTGAPRQQSGILEWILMAFGQPFEATSYAGLYKRFQDFLMEEYERGRRTVLVIDEAQTLGAERLEELRMVSNINAEEQILQLILVGQPDLKEILQSSEMLQFSQRVSSDYHLRPLLVPEVEKYIDHRLAVVRGSPDLFTRDAKAAISRASGGIPRVINILADTALVYGYASPRR
jgi:type II secretory pathway predicted ATPase ExeA